MFSSAVRIGTLSLKVLIWVAATLVTRSTGHGSLKCGPGSRIRANWPKRSTTPRSCSATSTKQLKASHSTSARPTQRSGLPRSEEHTSELQSLMRISYAVFCLKKKKHRKYRTKQPNKHRHND